MLLLRRLYETYLARNSFCFCFVLFTMDISSQLHHFGFVLICQFAKIRYQSLIILFYIMLIILDN